MDTIILADDILQDNVDVLTTLVSFLQSNGNRQAILSETGGGNTASCETLQAPRSIVLCIKCRSNSTM